MLTTRYQFSMTQFLVSSLVFGVTLSSGLVVTYSPKIAPYWAIGVSIAFACLVTTYFAVRIQFSERRPKSIALIMVACCIIVFAAFSIRARQEALSEQGRLIREAFERKAMQP